MFILAVDTATSYGGIAVYNDSTGQLSECRVGENTRQFSESIIEMTELCLRNLSLKIEQIDCLAVTSGPGSFTGLRVGLSAIKGLAYATGKPVVAVSTLLAHVWMFPFFEGYVCPVLDARKKEVYSGVYKWEGDHFNVVLKEGAYKLEEVLRRLDSPTVFIGDGVKVYRGEIEKTAGDKARFAPQNMSGGLPSTVARLAAQKAADGEFVDAASLVPEYFRKSEVELGNKDV